MLLRRLTKALGQEAPGYPATKVQGNLVEIFRKIADKAKGAKTQFDERRRVEKESTLSQTELRLEALNAQLHEKEAFLAAKEKTLQDEESRLRQLSRRPMYVLLSCTFTYGVLSFVTLTHYELVARETARPLITATGDAQTERPSKQMITSSSQPKSLLSGEDIPPSTLLAEEPLSVPSDPKAQFFVLEKGGRGFQRTIVTKRIGKSGTSYSKRLYNCSENTVKYLGSGESLSEMAASKADPDMGTILPGSIAYYVGIEACK